MIRVERLTEQNFDRYALDGFIRTHTVKRVYRRQGDEYALIEKPYVEDWSLEERRETARAVADAACISYLALDERGSVMGFISLKRALEAGYMVLDMLYVSAPWRGKGVGRRLFQKGQEEARRAGARALYCSACSSEETIAFYRAMGAVLTDRPIAHMAQAEPCDLQMVCAI